MRRSLFVPITLALLLTSWPYFQWSTAAQGSSKGGPTELRIVGAAKVPLVVSAADLKRAPRTILRVVNPHSNKAEVYEGVPLAFLLQKAGAPQGEQIRGPWMAAYVLVEAADGYRVVFSLAELDSGFLDSEVLLADTLGGVPLGAGEGPFKLVAPHDKRPGRWIRMVKSVTIVQAPNP